MKKVFAVLFVAASIVMASCGGAKETGSADSTATPAVDTTATTVVDTAAVKADTAAVKADTAATK